ncbi:GNAT family N-acetyltransferase [Rhodobacterales bacterium HKCCSP123]|nr:GNAT family N-acetyltransferase [Rhodobacterales bacterium HKCCSP123]
MAPSLSLIEPRSEPEMAAFNRLNWDYRDLLLSLPPEYSAIVRKVYTEEKYAAVLAAGEIDNRPPRGIMRLAMLDGAPVGVGTVQTLRTGDAEIKRVYVTPQAQGAGVGRAMMDRLIADCRALGFARILMDTGKVMTAARHLYDGLGFRRRGPYQEMPPEADGRMVFYEMPLE